jgi:hypothetical protein
VRVSELESAQCTLKEHLHKQNAVMAEVQAKYHTFAEDTSSKLAGLRQQISCFQTALDEQIQRLSTELQTLGLRNMNHEEVIQNDILQLRTDAKSTADEFKAILQRLSQLEKPDLNGKCNRLEEVCRGVEARISELEKQAVATRLADQQSAMDAMAVKVAGIENKSKSAMDAMAAKVAGIENRSKILAQNKVCTYLKSRNIKAINRDYIASLVENMYEKGISGREGKPELIVSLTSYPGRMYDLHLCLYSLLTQNLKPDKIILWLGKEQFPRGVEDVPKKVRDLEQWGLEIKWFTDLKSYKKLIPSLVEYPDAYIVTADDDIYYPSNWLQELWNSFKNTGAPIVAHRCHKVEYEKGAFRNYSSWKKSITNAEPSFLNFLTGVGGVLYSPNSLYKDILNIEKFQELCPNADDVWFWAMAVLKGTKITLAANPINTLTYINPEREANANDDGTLFSSNGLGGNDTQLAKVLEAYPELLEKLMSES